MVCARRGVRRCGCFWPNPRGDPVPGRQLGDGRRQRHQGCPHGGDGLGDPFPSCRRPRRRRATTTSGTPVACPRAVAWGGEARSRRAGGRSGAWSRPGSPCPLFIAESHPREPAGSIAPRSSQVDRRRHPTRGMAAPTLAGQLPPPRGPRTRWHASHGPRGPGIRGIKLATLETRTILSY